MSELEILVYDKREKSTASILVQPLGNNTFRMLENDLFNCDLTLGTEFEARLNEDGKHEVIRVTKTSEYITRRFLLSTKYNESEYRMIGDELVKQGGFWQVDMGGFITINIPPQLADYFSKALVDLGIQLTEIKDDIQ